MVLSSNNSLFFFRFWKFYFSLLLNPFTLFFDLTLGTRFFFSVLEKCLVVEWFSRGWFRRESSKNEKKKENGQKDSVSGSNREKIKMGSHAPPIQFLRRRNPNQRIYMATKRPNQTIRNMYSARIQELNPPDVKAKDHDKWKW